MGTDLGLTCHLTCDILLLRKVCEYMYIKELCYVQLNSFIPNHVWEGSIVF